MPKAKRTESLRSLKKSLATLHRKTESLESQIKNLEKREALANARKVINLDSGTIDTTVKVEAFDRMHMFATNWFIGHMLWDDSQTELQRDAIISAMLEACLGENVCAAMEKFREAVGSV